MTQPHPWAKPRTSVTEDGVGLVEDAAPPDGAIPRILRPAFDGVDLAEWAAAYRDRVDELLLTHRALMFRGFGIATAETFEAVCNAIAPTRR